MNNILKDFIYESANFWGVNPQFLTVAIFRRLYEQDEDPLKNHSSRIMWAMALFCDQVNSIYRNLYEDERKGMIAADYLEDPDFSWDGYEAHIAVFQELLKTRW